MLRIVYRVDGKLVGISVIDILPLCVSSVYFIWDPDYAWASLGKLSALREVALARDIRAAGAERMGWVYMGELGMCPVQGAAEDRLLDPGLPEDGVQVGVRAVVPLRSGKPRSSRTDFPS